MAIFYDSRIDVELCKTTEKSGKNVILHQFPLVLTGHRDKFEIPPLYKKPRLYG